MLHRNRLPVLFFLIVLSFSQPPPMKAQNTRVPINQNSFETSTNSWVASSTTPFPTDRNTVETSTSFHESTTDVQFTLNQYSFETTASPRETNSTTPFPTDRNTLETSRSFDKPTTDILFVINQSSFETATNPGIQSPATPVPTDINTLETSTSMDKPTTGTQFAINQSSFETATNPGIKTSATPVPTGRNTLETSITMDNPTRGIPFVLNQTAFKTAINREVTANTTTPVSTTRCITKRTTTKLPAKEPCVMMDKEFSDKLRQELLADKGYVEEIYLDQNEVPRFGIGHKITKKDLEFRKPVGTNVSKERIEEAFQADAKEALKSCCSLFKDFQNLLEDAQLIILNMRFNLGHTGMASFARFRQAVNNGDLNKAANEMEHSIWYKQVPIAAKRLVDRMRAVAEESIDCQ